LRRRGQTAIDGEPALIQPHFQAIAKADEGVARQPLAALDALEQKARLERLELQIGRDWRVQVCGDVEGWLQ
jgi:hypothetical protein